MSASDQLCLALVSVLTGALLGTPLMQRWLTRREVHHRYDVPKAKPRTRKRTRTRKK